MPTATAAPATFEPIGHLQARILHLMWTDPSIRTVHDVHRALNAQDGAKQLAYTTALTVMRNLARRGLVAQRKTGGRAHEFEPLVTREQYQRDFVRYALGTVFCGRSEDMRRALQFVEEG